MTENADILEGAFIFIEALESAIAANNAIGGGIVTDLDEIRQVASASAELLQFQLDMSRLMVNDSDEAKDIRAKAAAFMISED